MMMTLKSMCSHDIMYTAKLYLTVKKPNIHQNLGRIIVTLCQETIKWLKHHKKTKQFFSAEIGSFSIIDH